jgi:hypothetical protein
MLATTKLPRPQRWRVHFTCKYNLKLLSVTGGCQRAVLACVLIEVAQDALFPENYSTTTETVCKGKTIPFHPSDSGFIFLT